MPGPIIYGYFSLLVYGVLLHANDLGLPELPPLVCNCIGVFLAGNLGYLHEFVTGTPAILTVLPVVLVYAPGAAAVKSMLAALHNASGDFHTSTDIWVHAVFDLEQANVWGDLL